MRERKVRARESMYGTGRRCNALSPTDAAYIAGLIDGEGCIGISYRKPTLRSEFGVFQPMASINMNSRDVLRWLAEVTGLSSVLGPYTKRDGRHAQFYRWGCYSSGAASLLVQTVEFLKVKQENAHLLIQVDEELRSNPARMRDLEWLGQVKDTFHDLNAKGPRSSFRKTWAFDRCLFPVAVGQN